MADPLPSPQLPRRRRGYPNRNLLDAADARLRAQLAKLGRDDDTVDAAGTLAAAAAAALDAVHDQAVKAEEGSPRMQAKLKAAQRRVDALMRRAGIAVPNAPDKPRDRP
ncbi:hypothetical protein [Streptomyces kebangsaanensis]|uniref:hypothetical protein n=1 Tax=Streptomyces kebangsaanensis TaxID=864058 RepID=UPI00093B4B2C|nr:hypothetical protein [Streptomyces kebangsaanensis]